MQLNKLLVELDVSKLAGPVEYLRSIDGSRRDGLLAAHDPDEPVREHRGVVSHEREAYGFDSLARGNLEVGRGLNSNAVATFLKIEKVSRVLIGDDARDSDSMTGPPELKDVANGRERDGEGISDGGLENLEVA
jgi:hypothetical protein